MNMAMTPEAKVKKKVVSYLKEIGAYYFYPVTGGYGRSGVPDVVGCYNGRFFGIECKAGSNKPTPLQDKNLEDIGKAGGINLVINEENMNNTIELIERDYWCLIPLWGN
tara:strand:- start:1348 stop:1674 length:327 start_codon:yes stop_codon:yes gene_type:complete